MSRAALPSIVGRQRKDVDVRVEIQTRLLVEEPDVLKEGEVTIVDISCNGNNNGSITIHGEGGTPPYEYALNNSNQYQIDNRFIGLRVGEHRVKIRDANNCQFVYHFEIIEPEPLPDLVFIDFRNSYCDNDESVAIYYDPADAIVTGPGVDGNGNFNPSSLVPGEYEIKISLEREGLNGQTCSKDRSKIITIHPTTEASYEGLDDFYCWNDPQIEIVGIPSGGEFEGIGIIGNEFNAEQAIAAGVYDVSYTYTNEFGCTDVFVDQVEIGGPKLTIEEEVDINFSDSTQLVPHLDTNWNTQDIDFFWEPPIYLSCVECENPMVVLPVNDVIYTVTAMDQNGCAQTITTRVNVVKDFRVFIPSAFTPNGDGHNDILIFNSNWVQQVNYFRIFDRWGQMVFEAIDFEPNNEEFGWDGTFNGEELNSASFVYYTEFVFADGKVQSKSGSITLLK